MSFQIHDSSKRAISINALDKEAAALWDKEVHDTEYAYPIKLPENASAREIAYAIGGNWFDVIGHAIHSPEKYTSGWDDVKCTLWTIQAKSLYTNLFKKPFIEDNIKFIQELNEIERFLAPYFELIDYWQSKGYIPVNIKE